MVADYADGRQVERQAVEKVLESTANLGAYVKVVG